MLLLLLSGLHFIFTVHNRRDLTDGHGFYTELGKDATHYSHYALILELYNILRHINVGLP